MFSCEDCWREEEDAKGWVDVRLETDRGIEVLTYCPDCAVQFESDNVSPHDS
jgi:hypothetical protein